MSEGEEKLQGKAWSEDRARLRNKRNERSHDYAITDFEVGSRVLFQDSKGNYSRTGKVVSHRGQGRSVYIEGSDGATFLWNRRMVRRDPSYLGSQEAISVVIASRAGDRHGILKEAVPYYCTKVLPGGQEKKVTFLNSCKCQAADVTGDTYSVRAGEVGNCQQCVGKDKAMLGRVRRMKGA